MTWGCRGGAPGRANKPPDKKKTDHVDIQILKFENVMIVTIKWKGDCDQIDKSANWIIHPVWTFVEQTQTCDQYSNGTTFDTRNKLYLNLHLGF